ncbi:hypothetical protein Z948_2517 [Sulfitobacter donghicola DSW-25 = KCTC 12864 = JCM 14565]|nr:hypothetical protein Z948_2517 [Sulfitobacter donghicola DSW-25 = KCTC 12864 = JCM 14565]
MRFFNARSSYSAEYKPPEEGLCREKEQSRDCVDIRLPE